MLAKADVFWGLRFLRRISGKLSLDGAEGNYDSYLYVEFFSPGAISKRKSARFRVNSRFRMREWAEMNCCLLPLGKAGILA